MTGLKTTGAADDAATARAIGIVVKSEWIRSKLRCVNANGARAMQIFQMLGQVLSDTSLKIAEVDEDALGEWRVRFTNNVTVALGHEELIERVERFARVYRAVIEQRLDEVDHIDARYRNGVAVSWRGAETAKFQVAMASHKTEVIQ